MTRSVIKRNPNIDYSNFKERFGFSPLDYFLKLSKPKLIEIINDKRIRLNFCGSGFDTDKLMTEENCHYLSIIKREDLAREIVDEFFPCETLIKVMSEYEQIST